MKSKKLISLGGSLLFILGFVWLFFNYQHVVDQVVVSRFQPSQSISSISKDIQLTDRGNFLFLAGQPKLSQSEEFNDNCEKKAEQTVVLGCYIAPQRIYIFNVTDPRLSGVRQVTAAHEMLHVAYDRLGFSEKKKVNRMIESALSKVQSSEPDLAERLKVYDKTEPGERQNELHSILGTEAAVLPADLEQYYKQYFLDRSIVTKYADNYDKVFESIKLQQENLVSEMDALAKEINELTKEYNAAADQLNTDIDEFNQIADSEGSFGSQAEFDAQRAELLTRRNSVEAQRLLINTKVDEYERKRAKLDDVNVQVKELNSKIDSSSVPSL